MLKPALAIARKDLSIVLGGGQGVAQTTLLGLLVVFVFSLAKPPAEVISAQTAGAVFWLATAFASVIVFNLLYSLEEAAGARLGLIMSPAPVQAVWLGKTLAGLAVLLICQAVFLPAAVVFLGQGFGADAGETLRGLGTMLLVDWGVAVLGSLLGAMSQGHSARESLLSVVVFPVLIPALLCGVKAAASILAGPADLMGAETLRPVLETGWVTLALAFDAIFTGAALILFPFLYAGE